MFFSLITALALSAQADVWARLPEPVTNNAVAGLELDGRMMAYSFAGLHEGKTWRDVTADAYACDLGARECREIEGLPDGIGRLAAVAVTVREQIYIFGGYTVAEDGSERSTPEVWRFDPASESYSHLTDMPVPVDDTVALPFQDRYIYLVSGWHDTDNVDLVQVYDVEEDRWFQATPFPGAPVFGHAGAIGPTIEGTRLLVCGGTRVVPPPAPGERRSFQAIDDCWAGWIDEDPARIAWSQIAPLTGGAFYRGAGLSLGTHRFLFVAGTDNAFNFNGIGYNSTPSQPRGDQVLIDLESDGECARSGDRSEMSMWTAEANRMSGPDVMDVRGVIAFPASSNHFLLGGMKRDQQVSDAVILLPLSGSDYALILPHCAPDGTPD